MNRKPLNFWLTILLITTWLLSSCSSIPLLGKKVVVTIVFGSEKTEWLTPLIDTFNQAHNKTSTGEVIEIQGTAMGSIESIDAILAGTIQPTVWSPASSVYIPVANAEWRKTHTDDLVSPSSKDLVLSPVVIAMWKPMAEALGWPDKSIGWADIGSLAASDKGWEAYGYPEWGAFKFGHTHPGYSNSGIVAIIAQAYAGAGKQRDLTLTDLKTAKVRDFVASVQSSIIHYGSSTGFFASRMFERGPSYLSAAVLYENLVVSQESKRLDGSSTQPPVVAIYPKEGTFWSNHPYGILNAPWVTPVQKDAAGVFEAFLLGKPQQMKAIEIGFRPADPSIPLTAPLDAQHGVDIQQPKTVLEIPSAEVILGVQDLWKQTKKPVDLVVVFDTSGSMSGDKISSARSSLEQFITLLDDRDRLEIITFSSDLVTLTPLTELGPKRDDVNRRVSLIGESGDTSLYDAISKGYTDLIDQGDPKHIRAVVVLSDGQDTASSSTLEDAIQVISSTSEEGGNAIKVFTIAYGEGADTSVLKNLAESTGGKMYESKPDTIKSIYSEIATFF